MTKTKYFRKITLDRDQYGSVSLPKEALDSFLKKGCKHVEITWDSESDTLTLRPV